MLLRNAPVSITAEASPEPLPLFRAAIIGSIAAYVAAVWFSHPSQGTVKTLHLAALLLSAKYVLISSLAGTVAASITLRLATGEPFKAVVPITRRLVRKLLISSMLFPALALMLRESFIGLFLICPIVSVILALSLRPLLRNDPESISEPAEERALFAEQPPLPRRSTGWYAALFLYGTAIAIGFSELSTAGFLLAIAAALITWRWAAYNPIAPEAQRTSVPSGRRLTTSTVAALLVTLIALLPWIQSPSSDTEEASVFPHPVQAKVKYVPPETSDSWHAVLLWPFPPKKERMLPPIPRRLAVNTSAIPTVIPFDGEYRYYETPGKWIASRAHLAQGSPIDVNIHSADWGPLLMEAHQKLSLPIDLNCCRAIQMVVRNGDNRRGRIIVGLVLANSALPGKPSLIVEAQPVASTQPGRFTIKSAPLNETLTFSILDQQARSSTRNAGGSKLQQFDEITVLFLPDPERAALGAKIAIQSFTLIPR